MLYQKQLINYHSRKKNQFGDCMRTSIANLLDKPLEDVPNFSEGLRLGQANEMIRRIREYLHPRYFWFFMVPSNTPEEAMKWVSYFNKDKRYLLIGGTKVHNINHVVICRNEEVEFSTALINNPVIVPLYPHNKYFGIGMIEDINHN